MQSTLKSRPLKYQWIADDLRQRLSSLPTGTRLPSERELAEQFGCNVLTVRKSLANLVDEGRIERRLGSGTFVTDASEDDASLAGSAVAEPRTARGSRSATSRIGVLAISNTDAYGQQVVQALGRASAGSDVELRMAWVSGLGESAATQAAMMREDGCSALILPWFPHSQIGAAAEFTRRSALPVILPLVIPGLERHCFEAPTIFGHSMITSVTATCHYLHALGHRRIALIGPKNPADPVLQVKLSAYVCAMNTLGLDNLCGLLGPSSADADAQALAWQDLCPELAVVCYDDTHALRFVTAMHKLGMSAPADFAIIGANNLEASRYCDPPLTTLIQDFDYIGQCLLASALAAGRGETLQAHDQPPLRLLVRSSCGGTGRIDDTMVAAMEGHGILPCTDPVQTHAHG